MTSKDVIKPSWLSPSSYQTVRVRQLDIGCLPLLEDSLNPQHLPPFFIHSLTYRFTSLTLHPSLGRLPSPLPVRLGPSKTSRVSLLLMSRPLELALIKYDPVMNRNRILISLAAPLPFFSGILVVEYCFSFSFFLHEGRGR